MACFHISFIWRHNTCNIGISQIYRRRTPQNPSKYGLLPLCTLISCEIEKLFGLIKAKYNNSANFCEKTAKIDNKEGWRINWF